MLDHEAINQKQQELALYRRRLEHLFQQHATFGAYTPPYIALDIEQTQAAIREIKAQLRASSVVVGDHPDDVRTVRVGTALSPVLHQLRAPVNDFVGREQEIDQLVQALTKAGGNAAAISGIRGMGGIGKTELAYAVANRLRDSFPDAQIVVELRGESSPLTPEQALQTVIRSFEREAKLPENLLQLQQLYRSVLTGKKVLILADDARDAVQVRSLLPPSGCALLLTSRNRFSLQGMKTFDLDMLSPGDANILLLELCPRVEKYAGELAKLCGYLPLALRVSAGLLKENDSRDVVRFLEQLGAQRLKHLSDSDNHDDPQASVEASLLLSYDALNTDAQSALCQMSAFPMSIDREAAEAIIVTESDIFDVLELLRRGSLLEWDIVAKRYDLHDLVRLFAMERLEEADAVQERHAHYYVNVAGCADHLYLQGGKPMLEGLALFDREQVHINAGWSWARRQLGRFKADKLLLDYTNATKRVGTLRYDLRNERIPQLTDAIQTADRLNRAIDKATALCNLGIAYRRLGELQAAVSYHQKALRIVKTCGDLSTHAWVLSCCGRVYNRLAARSDDLKRLRYIRRAIAYHKQALAIRRELTARRDEGNSLGDLGSDHNILGEFEKALDYDRQWLRITHEIGDRVGECNALSNLGKDYHAQGDLQQASEYYKQVVILAQELGIRREVAFTTGNLGRILALQGAVVQAIELIQICVDYKRNIGHAEAEQDAAFLAHLRQRLTNE